jgi:dynein heavy chain
VHPDGDANFHADVYGRQTHVVSAIPLIATETPEQVRVRERSALRYQYYVCDGIADDVVAPIKADWVRNALGLLCTNISLVPERRVEELVKAMLIEMKHDYRQSIKRAILDYVLRNGKERRRLKIEKPPCAELPVWGLGTAPHAPPAWWREPIQRSFRLVSTSLFSVNPAMMQVLSIWEKYKDLLLVDIPTEEMLPLTIREFETMQKSHLDRVRRIFTNEWSADVEAVFRVYAREHGLTEENSNQFFEVRSATIAIRRHFLFCLCCCFLELLLLRHVV